VRNVYRELAPLELVHSFGERLISFEPNKEVCMIDIGLYFNKINLGSTGDLHQKMFH
jgi:hypothetical protein